MMDNLKKFLIMLMELKKKSTSKLFRLLYMKKIEFVFYNI
jgi:hypothetical protein